MKDDYLWNRSGKPDPDIQQLESLLGRLRFDRPPPGFPAPAADVAIPPVRSRMWVMLRQPVFYAAVASVTLAVLAATVWFVLDRPAYEVVGLGGFPAVDAQPFVGTGQLRVGQWLETDASSRARIQVGKIGQVDVEPNTRIGLVRARATEHRLSLQRGVMHAVIWAPPRLFFVNTPSAEAIDLGCAYTLEVDDHGHGLLRVASGWVAFERSGRESFVPGGAECLTRPGIGPGTPYMGDAVPAFRSALEKLDFGSAGPASRSVELAALLLNARVEDGLTLWHLLFRVGDAERPLVYDRLAELVPPPRGVSRNAVISGDRRTLDLWWNELGLGTTEWWRLWKRALPDSR